MNAFIKDWHEAFGFDPVPLTDLRLIRLVLRHHIQNDAAPYKAVKAGWLVSSYPCPAFDMLGVQTWRLDRRGYEYVEPAEA